MEKRVFFRSAWLPWVLMAPQVAVIALFFFWPAAQALLQSVQQSDAFGTSVDWVGLDNFRNLWNDDTYLASFYTTAIFSTLVAVVGISVSLLLAVFADRIVKGALAYKTLLIWPYAVAPAVAGVLWLFMFAPSVGVVSYWLRALGIDWNHLLNGTHAMMLVVMAAVWKQISYNFLFHWHYTPTGCSVSPHCDAAREYGSQLFYFNPEGDWQPEWGGGTLILDDAGRLSYDSAPTLEEFVAVHEAPSIGNQSTLIQRTDHAWHAVRPIACPEGRLRRVFIVVVNPDTLYWRVRDRIVGKQVQRF